VLAELQEVAREEAVAEQPLVGLGELEVLEKLEYGVGDEKETGIAEVASNSLGYEW